MLSELEGAVMLEVHMRNRRTAFQVRKAFLNSPTSDWSGSAGAVYPAIKRLEKYGFMVRSQTQDGRGTHELRLTDEGINALHEWATDPILASKLAADPFRTRSDYFASLPPKDRKHLFLEIRAKIAEAQALLDDLIVSDQPCKSEANTLAKHLLDSRKRWMSEMP